MECAASPAPVRVDVLPAMPSTASVSAGVAPYAVRDGDVLRLGNAFVGLTWQLTPECRLLSVQNALTGETMRLHAGGVWRMVLGGAVVGAGTPPTGVECDACEDSAGVYLTFASAAASVTLSCRIGAADHFCRLRIAVSPLRDDITLDEIDLFDGTLSLSESPERLVLNTLNDSCHVVLLRGTGGGVFTCIEFPYYRTTVERVGGGWRVRQGYAPQLRLAKDQVAASKPFVIGVYRGAAPASGVSAAPEGAGVWFRSYVAAISPPLRSPIRMHHGYGQGDLFPWSEAITSRERTQEALGIRYVYFSGKGNVGSLSTVEREPYRAALERLADRGKVGVTNVFWHRRGESVCLFRRMAELKDLMVNLAAMGYGAVNHDGLSTLRCSDPACGDAHDDDTHLFRKYEALVDVLRTATSVGIAYQEGHIGFWALGPFIARELSVIHAHDWSVHAEHLSAPRAIFETWLEKTKESWRRYLLPAHKYRGQVGHYRLWEEGRHPLPPDHVLIGHMWNREDGGFHDSRGWRIGLLGALAFGTQLSFSYLPSDLPPEDIAFARHWLAWQAENLDALSHARLCGASGEAAADTLVDVISKAGPDGGFVFCVNRDWVERRVELTFLLNVAPRAWRVRQLFPHPAACAGTQSERPSNQGITEVTLDPKSVAILEVRPASRGHAEAEPPAPAPLPLAPGRPAPPAVCVVDEIPADVDRRLRRLFGAASDGPLWIETWKLYPYADPSRTYLALEFDRPPAPDRSRFPVARVNGRALPLFPRVRLGAPSQPDALKLSRLLFADATRALRRDGNEIEVDTVQSGLRLLKQCLIAA